MFSSERFAIRREVIKICMYWGMGKSLAYINTWFKKWPVLWILTYAFKSQSGVTTVKLKWPLRMWFQTHSRVFINLKFLSYVRLGMPKGFKNSPNLLKMLAKDCKDYTWIKVEYSPSQPKGKASEVTKVLFKDIIPRYGLPSTIQSDPWIRFHHRNNTNSKQSFRYKVETALSMETPTYKKGWKRELHAPWRKLSPSCARKLTEKGTSCQLLSSVYRWFLEVD